MDQPTAMDGSRQTATNPANASETRAGKAERSMDDDGPDCDTGMGPLPRLRFAQNDILPASGGAERSRFRTPRGLPLRRRAATVTKS